MKASNKNGLNKTRTLGNDRHNTLKGSSANDTMIGGAGADDFYLSNGQDVITDFDPSEGDQIVLPEGTDFSKLQIQENNEDVILKIKDELKTKIEDTSLKDVIKSIADKARENALDAIKPEGTDGKQTIINTGLIVQGVNNDITLPTQTGISNVVVFDENNKPLNKRLYSVKGNEVTITKPKGYYKIAAEFDWNNSGSNYLTWMRDVIQFGDRDDTPGADPIKAKNAFRLYMGDKITDIENLSIAGSTSTYQMFDAAARFNGDLSHLELDEVTDMYSMFRHAARFNNGGSDGIKNWNTANATRMRMTFWNALSFNQPIQEGNWSVAAVEDEGFNGGMSRMFKNTPKFDQDLSNWAPNIYSGYQTDFNTSLGGNKQNKPNRYPNTKLPNFKGESPYDDNETVLRTRNLSRWKKGNKTITLPFNEDEIKEGIIKVQDNNGKDISFTLEGAKLTLPESGANQYTITVTGLAWDNSKYADKNSLLSKKENNLSWLNDVIQFADIDDDEKGDIASGKAAFAGYGGQTISDLDNLDTSELESTRRMFSAAYRFDQDLGENFLTSNVTDAFAMFSDAGVFNNGGSSSIGEWDTSNVTLMRSMFNKAALFNQELKGWDTSSVRDQAGGGTDLEGGMHNMFRNTPLYEEDLTRWDVEALVPELNTSFNTKAIKSGAIVADDGDPKALGDWPLFGQELDKGDGGNNGGGNNNNGGGGGDNGSGGGDNGGGDGGLDGAPGNENNGGNSGNGNGNNGGNSGGNGSIDGQPINPPVDPDQPNAPANALRNIDVKPNPKKSAFDLIERGSQKPDKVVGDSSVDKLTGKDQADILKGKGGDDYLFGDRHADTLNGGKGADVLQGGNGKDDLRGKAGRDVLYGGPGRDVLTGDNGKDVFVLSAGKDVINDFKVGKDDIGLVYALDLTFKQKGDDLRIKGNDGVNTLLLNVEKDDFLADYPDNLKLTPAVEVNLI